MLPIYVMHNNTLCIKKSYLKRFFYLRDELLNDFKVAKKGVYPKATDLLCFDSLPIVFKRLIIESFGTFDKPKNKYYSNPDILTKYLLIKIIELQKEIHNLKTSQGII